MQQLRHYFPDLTADQVQQFEALDPLYHEWNERINVISRKDIDNLYEHHILHSLAIAKLLSFKPGTRLLDVGTGGGFPGIPLAILFPECSFTLIDSIGKKIRVAEAVREGVRLSNVRCIQERAEEERGQYDFIISRAVMPLPDLVKLVRKNVSKEAHNALPNGLIVLKGGEISKEVFPYRRLAEVTPVSTFFSEEWFKEKHIIYLPL